jgi:hypothetical protein
MRLYVYKYLLYLFYNLSIKFFYPLKNHTLGVKNVKFYVYFNDKFSIFLIILLIIRVKKKQDFTVIKKFIFMQIKGSLTVE